MIIFAILSTKMDCRPVSRPRIAVVVTRCEVRNFLRSKSCVIADWDFSMYHLYWSLLFILQQLTSVQRRFTKYFR